MQCFWIANLSSADQPGFVRSCEMKPEEFVRAKNQICATDRETIVNAPYLSMMSDKEKAESVNGARKNMADLHCPAIP
jgi:hypothetical protein